MGCVPNQHTHQALQEDENAQKAGEMLRTPTYKDTLTTPNKVSGKKN